MIFERPEIREVSRLIALARAHGMRSTTVTMPLSPDSLVLVQTWLVNQGVESFYEHPILQLKWNS